MGPPAPPVEQGPLEIAPITVLYILGGVVALLVVVVVVVLAVWLMPSRKRETPNG